MILGLIFLSFFTAVTIQSRREYAEDITNMSRSKRMANKSIDGPASKARSYKDQLCLYTLIRIVILLVAMHFAFIRPVMAQYSFLYKTPVYLFDLPNSMEGNEVQDIYQDKAGYMWFASKAGLVRYNGRDFEVYTNNLADSTSISSNAVEVVLETKAGDFWVGTWGDGLNKMDRNTGQFTRYQANNSGLPDDYIADLVEDDQGQLWIATRLGLCRLDLETETFKVFLPEEDNPRSLSHFEVRTLYIDQQQTLWVGTGYPWEDNTLGGLNKYDPVTESFTHYQVGMANAEDGLQDNKITAIYEDSEHNFWIGTRYNKIHLMDRKTGAFQYLDELSQFGIGNDSTTHVRSFFEADDGSIWICSYGSGLRNYDLKKSALRDELYDDGTDGNFFYPINQAWKIYKSRDRTLWICTGDIGDNVFKSNSLLPSLGLVYQGDYIHSLYVNQRTGSTWIGRLYNGLNRGNWEEPIPSSTWFDGPTDDYVGSWSFASNTQSTKLFDNIFTMKEDRYGALWFGKDQQQDGLYRFDPSAKQVQQFKHDPKDANTIADNVVMDIICSADEKSLWVTTSDGTLHHVDAASYKITRINDTSRSDFPEGINISRRAVDGTLWLGGVSPKGQMHLSAYDPNTQRIVYYPLAQLNPKMANNPLVGLTIDKAGNIWLAAEQLITKLDTQRKISVYPLPETGNGRIISMIFDKNEHLWLATSIGVTVFRPEDSSFYSYPSDFEIPALPFHLRAADRMVGGELLLCGRGGCLLINEATVANNFNQYTKPKTIASSQILYTNFLVNGNEVDTGPYAIDDILTDYEVTLGHLDNNFSIELALLDFKQPDLNHFEYFLEDYDNYWRETGDKNIAYYSQIPPGNYRLLVKGYNAEGEYGEGIPLRITVLPPWWRTWWAIAGYALLLFGLIYGIYRFQLSRQLTKAETRRLQELDVAKTQLYTNITHEFRTPLTVILGMAKQLHGQLPNAQNLMVEMISRNGQNLLNLVNQMLDLSKLESGQMTVQLQQGDLIIYLKYLVESFHSYAETRRVTIHFLSDLETVVMDFDPNKIQQVISNVLSNAIKFTPSGGDIYLSIDVLQSVKEEFLVRIKDTGVGIEPERLPHIFERFYQADDSYTKEFAGTGIGLALVAELVKLMGGAISAKSEVGKGTEITIRLPITRESQTSADLSYFDRALHQFHREGVAPQERERIALTANANDKPTILIVEDNYDVRTYICACLSDSFNLLTAENGQRGVERAMEHTPDFIISDVMMPLKDGYALVRELKMDKRTSHIPIILLTAKADVNSKLIGLKQGADAYLAKPFNPEELIVRVNKLLELRQRLQQHLLHQPTEEDAEIATEHIAQENQFLQQVNAIIYAHLDDMDLDVKAICKRMNMSHSQLHRKLSALTGLSINRYMRHLRVERAKVLLREPGLTVTAVAYDTGYKDPSYFGRVFKQETGMTPAEWQREG